ncbi:glycosyltransferase family 4 protein [Balneatrix alpica]|uniref:Glycosyltransferase family 4 protein n=1 Tax=Balneatrix alpica TaxID=75684 RepID=A0ABV5ZB20_9GAMM|nr:glycosyltransferase family 4 protein [Balneatrix alpica]
MKIAFIDVTTTVSFGGIQTAVWQLAIALSDLGHEVHVYGGEGTLQPELMGRPVQVHRFAFTPRERVLDIGSRFQRLVERWSFARQAKAHFIAQQFDWAVLTKPFDFFWPRLMPAGQPTRFAFMSGGTDFFRGDRWLAKRVDAWLACSHFNAWQLQHHYKCFPQVMYNGVMVEHFAPVDAQGLRQQLGYQPQDVVFGFAGRLVGWKGLKVAIAALAEPELQGLPVKLLLIGDGEAKAALQAQAQQLGVAERVQFYGRVEHHRLPEFYSACDAGVFPSIGDEAFGITIAEAMSCALPVVASHVGGIPEVVGNEGHCGLLFTPGHSAALASMMAALARDAALRERLGQQARQRIIQHYSWQASAQRLLAALQGAQHD